MQHTVNLLSVSIYVYKNRIISELIATLKSSKSCSLAFHPLVPSLPNEKRNITTVPTPLHCMSLLLCLTQIGL